MSRKSIKIHRALFARATRKPRGVTTVALIIVIACFVILPLALFGFEIGRVVIAQGQLQNVTDAAALAGTAALASSPQGLTVEQLHEIAMEVADQNFRQNGVLTTAFNASNVVSHKNDGTRETNPPVESAILNITLVDQDGNPQPNGSTTATNMRIETFYNLRTAFASQILPIGRSAVVTGTSNGGLPELDIILCFDLSGSMDDQTPVTFVKRFWDPALGYVNYQAVRTGTIFQTTRPPNDGTGLNCLRPQNLSFAAYPSPSNATPQVFSDGIFPSPNLLSGLRGNQFTYPAGSLPSPNVAATRYPPGPLIPEQGWPPGNFDPTLPSNLSGNGVNPNAYPNGFTDMVVQVPSAGGFTFPNIATCVEASRGNLESVEILRQSQGNGLINPTLPTPQAGYYDAYWRGVETMAQPIADSRRAASNFFFIMNVSSKGHFGLSTFSDTAGTAPDSIWTGTNSNIDSNWLSGGTGTFPVPLVSLEKTETNYEEVTDAINGTGSYTRPIGPTGATNIAASLQIAVNHLVDNTRARDTARKAIVLFTDGVPNRPTNINTGRNQAFTQAGRARTAGIPIYTIGLSQNPSISSLQDSILGDNRNGSGNGIAARSGNGAIYIRVNNSADLEAAFQTIARSLVVLQRN